MTAPREGKSGLAKATAILASILGIAFGLCGLNLVGFMAFGALGKSVPAGKGPIALLVVASSIEVIGIVVSIFGLLIVASIVISRAIFKPSTPGDEKPRN